MGHGGARPPPVEPGQASHLLSGFQAPEAWPPAHHGVGGGRRRGPPHGCLQSGPPLFIWEKVSCGCWASGREAGRIPGQ